MLQKKICILGATGVGKTSLTKQFVEGIFSQKYHTSIGVKVDKKLVKLDSTEVQLMLWDLEGIDKYCGFNPRYLRGASGVILVADQTRVSSLSEALEIYALVKNEISAPIILALNKTDLSASEKWQNTIDTLPKDRFSSVFNTSAKTGQCVESMFHSMAKLVVN